MTALTDRDKLEAPLIAAIAVLAVLVLPTLGAWWIDTRQLRGINVWDKPLKFELSLALHLFTLLLAVRLLSPSQAPRDVLVVRRSLLAICACSVLEIAYIVLQAARGRESHFNRETAVEGFLYYGVMGPAALVILAGTAAVGWVLWKRQRNTSGLAYGMALGLLVGSALTLVAVVPLSSGIAGGLGHWVGGVRSDANGLAFFGWSTTGGDLRVPHFVATHLVQAIPAAGRLADRIGPWPGRRLPQAVALLGAASVAALLAQAVSGNPFISP